MVIFLLWKLFAVNVATPAFLINTYMLNLSILLSTLTLLQYLKCISYRQHLSGTGFSFLYFANLCLIKTMYKMFTFNVLRICWVLSLARILCISLFYLYSFLFVFAFFLLPSCGALNIFRIPLWRAISCCFGLVVKVRILQCCPVTLGVCGSLVITRQRSHLHLSFGPVRCHTSPVCLIIARWHGTPGSPPSLCSWG